MARQPRGETQPGSVYHVIFRGNNKQAVFRSGADLAWFCDRLKELKKEYGFELYAYCLMSNHVHLLVRQARDPLGAVMKRLLGSYAARFNGLYDHVGHVFSGRFRAIPCLNDRYFVTLLRYIHRNPVEAGMVKRAGDWKYSGHRELLGAPGQGLIDADFPLACLAENAEDARREYEFLTAKEESRPPWLQAMHELCARNGVLFEEIQGQRRGLYAEVRLQAILAALEAGGWSAEVTRALACSRSTISRARGSAQETEPESLPLINNEAAASAAA